MNNGHDLICNYYCSTVLFPKVISLLGDRLFMMEEFSFFVTIIEKMLKDREDSKQV